MDEPTSVPDVRKQVTVPIPAERAFAIFAEHPIEWWPEKHVFVKDRQSITIEARVGGRYYERGADGGEVDWGTVVEWDPSRRIVLTWRVGPGWSPLPSDEGASFIEVDFEPAGLESSTVVLTHSGLERHGPIATMIHAALDGPDPGETLAQYSNAVTRQISLQARGAGPVTLINRFTVSASPQEFERAFADTSQFFAEQPGFIENTLMSAVGDPTSYVNVARWLDAVSLERAVAHPDFASHNLALRGLATSTPAIYSPCEHVVATELAPAGA